MSDRQYYYGVYLQVLFGTSVNVDGQSVGQKRLQGMVFPHPSAPSDGRVVRHWTRQQDHSRHRALWTLRTLNVDEVIGSFERRLNNWPDAALTIITARMTSSDLQDVWVENKTPYKVMRVFERAARARGIELKI